MWLYLFLIAVQDKVSNKLHTSTVFLRYPLNRMGADSEPVLDIWRKGIKILVYIIVDPVQALMQVPRWLREDTWNISSSAVRISMMS